MSLKREYQREEKEDYFSDSSSCAAEDWRHAIGEKNANAIVALWQRHQAYLEKMYGIYHAPFCILKYLARAKSPPVSLEQIKMVYESFGVKPSHLFLLEDYDLSILHIACKNPSASPDVIEWLARTCPDAAWTHSSDHDLPIALVFSCSTPTLRVTKALVEAHPKWASDPHQATSCLFLAFQNSSVSLDVLEYLVQKYVDGKSRKSFHLGESMPYRYCSEPMGVARVSLLVGMLPQLREFKCSTGGIQPEALCLLLKGLVNSNDINLTHFYVSGDMRTHPGYGKDAQDSLIDIIRSNKKIARMRWIVSLPCGVEANELMDALKVNTNLKEFKYCHQFATPSYAAKESLLNMLSNHNTTLELLEFNGCTFRNEPIQYFLLLNAFGRRKVQSVDMTLKGFVKLLVEAKTRIQADPLRHHNALYGLLHLSPGLWTA